MQALLAQTTILPLPLPAVKLVFALHTNFSRLWTSKRRKQTHSEADDVIVAEFLNKFLNIDDRFD